MPEETRKEIEQPPDAAGHKNDQPVNQAPSHKDERDSYTFHDWALI